MKITTAILAAVLGGIAVAEIKTETICERSDASPYLHNVQEMIDNLKKAEKGKNLCNVDTNGCGETITSYSGSGGAAFMICGGGYRCSGDPGGMACAGGAANGCGGVAPGIVAWHIEDIRDKCQGPDSNGDIRVGGRQHSSNDGKAVEEVKLFSKPG